MNRNKVFENISALIDDINEKTLSFLGVKIEKREEYAIDYLYCAELGMEKYMKFTMFEKETKDEKYHNDPYRAVNFKIDKNGSLICPNGKKFMNVKIVRAVLIKKNVVGGLRETEL